MIKSYRLDGRICRRELGATVLAALAACAGEKAHATGVKHAEAPRATLARRSLPLFEAFPALARNVPYIPLGTFPTPIARADALGAELGIPALYLKRDDGSGEYGGGKTRKLELLLGDASSSGCTRIVTSGSVGSNHAAATAVYARRTGLRATLLLLPEPATEHVRRNLEVMIAHGAELRLVGHESLARAEREARGDPATKVIPAGGTSMLGNLGFVNAAFELAAQIEAGAMPKPDVVYLALGTMGSAAGLALGLAAAGLGKTRIVAVRASSPATSDERRLHAMIAETSAYVRERSPTFPDVATRVDVNVDGGHLGRGYALPTTEALSAVERARRLERLELEATYTGKALAALVDDRTKLPDRVVLFWCSNDSRSRDDPTIGARDAPPALRAWLARG